MEKIKEKAIELLLDIISKEDFEVILYEKVKTENLITNRFLFDLVNINYRENKYKIQLGKILEDTLEEEIFIMYKVNFYSKKIKDENNIKEIYKHFNNVFELFEYDKEYSLMWDYYQINERIGLIEIKYEIEKNVIIDLKKLCDRVCFEFNKISRIEDKVKLLVEGLSESKDVSFLNNQIQTNEIKLKKWYQFWKY
ncbi:hypothetical protein LPB136_04435 [Tenacibaculum todarodis]|uniref:Uncharacterized protein n=1 Tax=Tenacibaculum todarodis TaxID=1850252 RepID=A0A1L3JHN8_9FLAO|nr:hypothetical protein [Tenacibaculum todarodis]APG64656.1 hypothetical protein LPB136_04435 [Tenacibaculum todarodis]